MTLPELVRTLRVPIGDGNDGKVYAVAISPDGVWAAVAGWSGAVYIFEAATGRLSARLGKFDHAIFQLTFSPDGSRLAATFHGGAGIRVWETAGWRLLAEDKDYGGKACYGAAFDGASHLYTVAFDRQIRRYGTNGQLEAKASTQCGNEPYSVASNPQGIKLAVGFYDTTAVAVYDACTLQQLYAPNTGGISRGDLSSVAWSADGTRLYAGGRYQSRDLCSLVIWRDEGSGKRSEAPLSPELIVTILPCGGGLAVGTGGPAFGLIAADGAKRIWQGGVTVDMRRQSRAAFGFSADGRLARFGLGEGTKQPVLFDLTAFQLLDATGSLADLTQARVIGLAVTEWKDTTAPKLNGNLITLWAYEMSRSLSIAPDASCFVLGTEWHLRAYRDDGAELWQKQVPGVAWGVHISGNGKLVAAAYDDGTIRWHRMADGEELLALFVHAKDKRYIAWTPKGYYAASPGAEDLIGWHVNRGFDAAPDFYPAPTFASTFNRPDIVKAALDI